MKIFDAEKEIEDKILASATLLFASQPTKATKEDIERMCSEGPVIKNMLKSLDTSMRPLQTENPELYKSLASIDDKDLYYHKSILVTTAWNANDDVFLPANVWAAKYSPVHKPTNLNHDSDQIVGHITSSWAIDIEGNFIDDSTKVEDLPDKFHVLVGSVIYKDYNSETHRDNIDKQDAIDSLIGGIEDGTEFVSMEAVGRGFDYVLRAVNPDGSINAADSGKVVERNEGTAFLTKHLRVFGGSGQYEGFRIGRALKNISFIGKGYTPKPANKESIIFTESNTMKDVFDASAAVDFSFSKATKEVELKEVINSIESDDIDCKSMSEPIDSDDVLSRYHKNSVISNSKTDFNGDHSMADVLQEQMKDLKEHNVALSKTVDDLKDQLAKADVQKFTGEIDSLTEQVKSLQDEVKASAESVEKVDADLKDASKQVESLTDANKVLQEQVDSVEAEKVVAQRVSTLVDGSIAKDVAEVKVELFSNLSDEQFEVIAKELIDAAKASAGSDSEGAQGSDESDETPEEKSEKADEKVDEQVAEAADVNSSDADKDEINKAEASANTDEDEVLSVVASLSKKLKLELCDKGAK